MILGRAEEEAATMSYKGQQVEEAYDGTPMTACLD